MAAASTSFEIHTRGNSQVLDITARVAEKIADGPISTGVATVFIIGSTAGITTTEFEPGIAQHDLKELFERIAPSDAEYVHEKTWQDDNGHSHLRAALIGPSLPVPFVDRRLLLGTWQQIVLIDFDTRPRTRTVIVQLVG
jgi:secondary thiamine-phosphate synthase enzyme